MPDKHALLGPSSAHIWCACPPSARLGENVKDGGSEFAAEGTRAHALCERKLRVLSGEAAPLSCNKVVKDGNTVYLLDGEEYDTEMWDCSEQYRDFVEEELNAARAKTRDAELLVEVEVDFSNYVPEGFGTSDAVIVGDDMLEVIDFKYGKGVRVDPVGNPQLRLYALGTYLSLGQIYDFSAVKTTVFQPRIQNVGSDEIPVQELIDWAEDYVKPRAALAFAGKGDFCVGEHCRFCKAGGVCRARAEDAFRIIDMADTKPVLLDDAEIPAILDKLDNAEKWIAAIRRYAETRAVVDGVKWDGYKLVESRTFRKIGDQFKALEILNSAGYSSDEVTTVKLKGITDLEKMLGKVEFNEMLGTLVVKPHGAPTLVKESDKRPEYNNVEDAFKEEI